MFLFFINSVKRKKIIVFFVIILAFFIMGQGVLADDYGLGESANKAFDDNIPFKEGGLAVAIGRIVGAALAFIGIVFFILIIYGGFTWMTARGNEEKVTKAKELIINASIGLVIVLAAYAIVSYIGGTLID